MSDEGIFSKVFTIYIEQYGNDYGNGNFKFFLIFCSTAHMFETDFHYSFEKPICKPMCTETFPNCKQQPEPEFFMVLKMVYELLVKVTDQTQIKSTAALIFHLIVAFIVISSSSIKIPAPFLYIWCNNKPSSLTS